MSKEFTYEEKYKYLLQAFEDIVSMSFEIERPRCYCPGNCDCRELVLNSGFNLDKTVILGLEDQQLRTQRIIEQQAYKEKEARQKAARLAKKQLKQKNKTK